MPTFDAGHCFLTTLIPINSAAIVDQNGLKSSHVQLVRNVLSMMPTAHQSPATDRAPCNSPFSRCTKTHFARLVVLDDVIFNGRLPENSLAVALRSEDPTVPKASDKLPTPYLIFIADFDAPQGTRTELRDWLRGVWSNMRADLDPVFVHCFEYANRVKDADTFADYVIAHQLDTTMPFNDYWPVNMPPPLPSLSLWLLAMVAIVAGTAAGYALYWLLGLAGLLADIRLWHLLEIVFLVLVGLGTALYAAYRMVMRAGLRPFPMAPNSDLPSILKAMHLQRQLIKLVPGLQGQSDQVLFDEVGKFLNAMEVDNLHAPTQSPGTIGA